MLQEKLKGQLQWLNKLKLIIGILSFIILSQSTTAQLTVNKGLTPDQYVKQVLIGQGVTVSNVTFKGTTDQIGSFDGTNSNIGLKNGLILSTGDVNDAIGPNNTGSKSSSQGGSGDPDLALIANSNINDAAVLEFDFIPNGDTLKFRYVFGSEEYLEFVNSGFNDAFGFFVSGPGLSGIYSNNAENIALIPGTSIPVTIDNVNNVSNKNYYVKNNNGISIQYDGFTVVMEAVVVVICGQKYHIKLAIGDAGDSAYDSGVFLEGGSFSSNGVNISLTTDVPSVKLDSLTYDSVIVEGCMSANFDFTRQDTSADYTIKLFYGGNAQSGIDYKALPDSIVLPKGSFSKSILVEAIKDNLTEGIDTLEISIQTITACGDTIYISSSLYILDEYDLQVIATDTVLSCQYDSTILVVQATGGLPPYSYTWNNGQLNDTIYFPAQKDTFIVVSAIDSCGIGPFSDTAFIHLNIISPQVNVLNDTIIFCQSDTVSLTALASSGTGIGYDYTWSTGETSSQITVYPFSDSTYYVTVTDNCGLLFASDSAKITFGVPSIILNTTNDTILECANDIAFLSSKATGGTPPYSYMWSNGKSGQNININPIETQTFYVTATDDCGAPASIDSILVTVTTYPPINITANNISVVCAGDNATITTSVSGGNPNYTYKWDNNKTTSSITVNPTATSSYIVTVTDMCGVDTSKTITVTVPVYPPLKIDFFGDSSVICAGDTAIFSGIISGGSGFGYNHTWTLPSGSSTKDTITFAPLSTTDFVFQVTDGCNTSSSDTHQLIVPVYDPLIILPLSDTIICEGENVIFPFNFTGGSGNFTYSSSGPLPVSQNNSSVTIAKAQQGLYTVTLTGQCGEMALEDFVVSYRNCELIIPNVFTPSNNDGFNDVFYIEHLELHPNSLLEIFNRWGNKIYSNEDYKNDWNGTHYKTGNQLPDGVYYYVLTTKKGTVSTGNVTLIR